MDQVDNRKSVFFLTLDLLSMTNISSCNNHFGKMRNTKIRFYQSNLDIFSHQIQPHRAKVINKSLIE